MAVTIKDIARELGVSPATVSLALNDSRMVNAQTAQQVKEAAARMGYVRNVFARSLVKGRSIAIGLMVPDIENPFYASLVKEVSMAAEKAGYRLSIYISNDSAERERSIISELMTQNFRAVIFAPVNSTPSNPEYLKWLNSRHELPLLFLGTRYKNTELPCVCINLEHAVYEVTRHMIESGARRLAILNGPEGVDTLDVRSVGFMRAVNEAGIEAEIWHAASVNYQSAYDFMNEKSTDDIPDGIVCVSDIMALAAFNSFSIKGLKVPGDVMLSGLDDGLIAGIAPIALTTVNPRLDVMAEKIIDMVRRISDGETFTGNYYIDYALVRRDSTKR